ncbi:MAG: polysaccharide deacetylase [Alicyclobacillus sp.]|nr:polysaccharide deacetylase [Alicyclobacillus sp.]
MASRLIRSVWLAWESLFHWVWRVQPLEPGVRHLFYVSMTRYMGKPFTVDGVTVRRFDPIIELHMNNEMLMNALREQKNVVSLAVKLLQEAKRSLPALANCVRDEKFAKAKALYGITFIHRGVERFGFTTFPLRQRLFHRITTAYLKFIFRMVNPRAVALLATHPDIFEPRLVVISKMRLLTQYATRAEEEAQPASAAPQHSPV